MQSTRGLTRLKNWLWSGLIGAVLVGGLAALWLKSQTPIYQARAEFVLEPAEGKPVTREQVELYRSWMISEPVLAEVWKNSSELADSAESFKANLRASADDANHLYWLYEDQDPVIAATIVNRIGESFTRLDAMRQAAAFSEAQQGISVIKQKQQLILTDSQTAIAITNNEITLLKKALDAPNLTQKKKDELKQELAEQNGKLIALQASLNTAQASYNDADLAEQELLAEIGRKSDRLVSLNPATPPTIPIRPDLWRGTAIGSLLGFLLGVGAGILRSRSSIENKLLDQSQGSDSAESFDRPVWARLPISDPKPSMLLLNPQTQAAFGAHYQQIEKHLAKTFHDSSRYLLAIAGAEVDGQSDLFAANLAIALAHRGRNVILVDLNVERPIIHQLFSLSNQRGLTTAVLDSKLQIERHLQETTVDGLQFVARGPMATASADFINHPRLQQLLSTLVETHDCFILNLGALQQLETLSPILSHAPHCLLTIPASFSTPQLTTFEMRLKKAGLNLIGLVIQTDEKETLNGKKHSLLTPKSNSISG